MPMDFQSEDNKYSYSSRDASMEWVEFLKSYVPSSGFQAADIGCGGGIYSMALIELGAAHVNAVDSSKKMLEAARENCIQIGNRIQFVHGEASNTGLQSNSLDVVVERALIHHVSDLEPCFLEIERILKPNGVVVIQDRTPEDCLLPGSKTHVRGYFFEEAPELIKAETMRRHSSERVHEALRKSGFTKIKEVKLWETRKRYSTLNKLVNDLRKRTGRSILFELTDDRLEKMIHYIERKLQDETDIMERDRWTCWIAQKNDRV